MEPGPARRAVVQYVERKRLKGLGITTDINDLDADTVDGLLIVDTYLDELRNMDDARNRRRNGRG